MLSDLQGIACGVRPIAFVSVVLPGENLVQALRLDRSQVLNRRRRRQARCLLPFEDNSGRPLGVAPAGQTCVAGGGCRDGDLRHGLFPGPIDALG